MNKFRRLLSALKKSTSKYIKKINTAKKGLVIVQSDLTEHEKSFLNNIFQKIMFFVGIPAILTFIFLAVFAQNFYQSESKFIIQAKSQEQNFAGGLLGGLSNVTTNYDLYVIKQFILSRDLLKTLIQDHDFESLHARRGLDFIFGLSQGSDFDTIFKYYQSKTQISYDPTSSILTLKVQAPTAQGAQELSQAILRYSEQTVNLLSKRAYEDRVMFASQELKKSEEKLKMAKSALVQFQNNIKEVNPLEKVQSIVHIRNELESELAHTKASFEEMQLVKKIDSLECQQLERKIIALNSQIDKENAKLVSVQTAGLNTMISEQEALLIAKEFSENLYQLSLSELEKARMDAIKQTRYLVTVASPSLPDFPFTPKIFHGVLTVSLVSFLILTILSLLVATIREHALH